MSTYNDIRIRFQVGINRMNEKEVPVEIDDDLVGTIDDENPMFNDVKNRISALVGGVEFEDFLLTHLTEKKLTGSELKFAHSKILQAYANNPFETSYLIEQLKTSPIPIKELASSSSLVGDISNKFKVPMEFVNSVFAISGKPGSASIGAGEFMLILFTDLLSATSKDLMDSKGVIYEVKDNGKKDAGFRVGSQGKPASNAIKMLNDLHPDFDISLKSGFNTSPSGSGVYLGTILNTLSQHLSEIKLEMFAKAFLTFENAYDRSIDKVTEKIANSKEDIELFRRYLACLQMWGYMSEERIQNVVLFSQSKGKPNRIGLVSFEKNFAKFFQQYSKTLLAGGWENDGRNMSFRIRFK
jgi:hypothetical protein